MSTDRDDKMKDAVTIGDSEPYVSDGLRCSVCRKKIRTATQRRDGRIGAEVCICEHHWLTDAVYDAPLVINIKPLDTA